MGVYVFRNNQVEGPFDELVLQQALANGTMSPEEPCCREGEDEWKPAFVYFRLKPKLVPQPVSKPFYRRIFSSTLEKIKKLSPPKRIALLLLSIPAMFIAGLVCLVILGAILNINAEPGTVVQQAMFNAIQQKLEREKQPIFQSFHPMGTAKNITLHDLTITAWKNGIPTNRIEDAQECQYRFTLYWSSPLISDGYTKISQKLDMENGQYQRPEILATNGLTNKDAGDAFLTVLGTWLQYEAQKSGSEQAAKDYYNKQ